MPDWEWRFALLCKFPLLDVRWAVEVQAKWWGCWTRLLHLPKLPNLEADRPPHLLASGGADGDGAVWVLMLGNGQEAEVADDGAR